jgi:hypothetical protein
MARTALDRFALPADAVLTPCAHCGEHVESVDSRHRCDDCANDRLLIAIEEVSVDDVRVAVALGARLFTMRASRVAVFVRRPAAAPCSARWVA